MGNTPTRRGLDKDKYTVRAEYENSGDGRRLDFDEVFVLRRGDVLATAALRSYVANALLMLDTDGAMKRDGRGGFLDAMEVEHLRWLADDVNRLADNWEGHNHAKLPD